MLQLKTLSLLFIVFLSSTNLSEIRSLYVELTTSKAKQKAFVAYMQKTDTATPILQAYKGASYILQSKTTSERKLRKQFFMKGAKLIDNAAVKEPGNIEIRLIRLSIQENIPKALGYNANILDDVAQIREGLKNITDAELKQYIARYIKQSKSFK
ncbi:hypothetical protein GGR32_000262 [Mesonia hippocampi]|uniref:Uncharacterized protein n=1 Tax=Mesonia hippocampi TaxID=1628250 RepID=A0A840ELX7_9FLAO|nr:hypothetical protein [Mesonia hippocampi]MBB4117990.1 hypothetical protein [Mesonia hippocampi]